MIKIILPLTSIEKYKNFSFHYYSDNQIGRLDLPAAVVQPTPAFNYGSADRPCQAESAGRFAVGPAARLTHPTAPSEGHNC